VQIVDGIKNATATQLDVADIGSLSDLVSQVNFILIVTEQVLFHNLQ
jgi:alpha-aminoadipic semialdehyde synthase